MLASMSNIDPVADTPLVDWSELSVSGLLPTGTVTLLLADIGGSTRLWETQPSQLARAPRVNTGIDRFGRDDGERCGQGEVVLERFDPGAADDGGQCQGGLQHREVVPDT